MRIIRYSRYERRSWRPKNRETTAKKKRGRQQDGGEYRGDYRSIEQRWIPEFRGRHAIANSCFPIQIDRGQSSTANIAAFVSSVSQFPFLNQPFLSPIIAPSIPAELRAIKYIHTDRNNYIIKVKTHKINILILSDT